MSEEGLLSFIGISRKKFFNWKQVYGEPRKYSDNFSRINMITAEEKELIIDFYRKHPLDGYRRCAYMMIDKDIAFVQPSSVYRILKEADVMRSRTVKSSSKGTGFVQPLKPHEQWHSDISNVTAGDTVYHLISIIDGYSRSVIAWHLREKMKTFDVNIVFQKAKELYPDARPRCISDNGKQYKCQEFAQFISRNEYSHTTTSPYYPQSNGKQERFHGTIKKECIRIQCPLNLDDAKKIIEKYIQYYNKERLHSAISYIAPHDKLDGKEAIIFAKRDQKLKLAKENRARVNTNNYKQKQRNHVIELFRQYDKVELSKVVN